MTDKSALTRKQFLTGLAGCTIGLMVPGIALGDDVAAKPWSDRLGQLLPQRKLGTTDQLVTNLCVGRSHVGDAPMKDAQAVIEKALEAGVRFFDNAHMYQGGEAERRFGRFLTPKYRDVCYIMTKTQAKDKAGALRELDESLRRMKTDHVDLWQIHAINSPADVERRIRGGVLDALLEAQAAGKVRHIGFTGHTSYKAHVKMLDEIERRGITMAACQMPVNPADPHYESFVVHVLPRCVEMGIGVLAMKTLAYGRFFGGNIGWSRKNARVRPAVPDVLSLEDVLGFVWSLPVSSLVSGMENVEQVAQNAGIARKSWTWDEAERQKRIDAMAGLAGPSLEFYKA